MQIKRSQLKKQYAKHKKNKSNGEPRVLQRFKSSDEFEPPPVYQSGANASSLATFQGMFSPSVLRNGSLENQRYDSEATTVKQFKSSSQLLLLKQQNLLSGSVEVPKEEDKRLFPP